MSVSGVEALRVDVGAADPDHGELVAPDAAREHFFLAGRGIEAPGVAVLDERHGEGPVLVADDQEAGVRALYDDRAAGAGEKLTDAELVGCPLRVVVGKRALAEGEVEAQVRRTGADSRLPAADASGVLELLNGID